MVRRALSNLISNAMRYTPAAGSIAVSIARSEGDVLVAVENDGPEIPEEHLPHLFDRFYRADKSAPSLIPIPLDWAYPSRRPLCGPTRERHRTLVTGKTRFTLRFPNMTF
jgi:two-component system heavy metal sensor histidine kinase CusS